jgi:hypothetical protein
LVVSGCSTDSLPDYTLTIEITPEGAGTTDPLPGGFDEGANLELEAIPAENYLFERWEGNLTTESNPADLTMNSDKLITAVFKRAPLTTGGDGSEADPFWVRTLDDLNAMGREENLDKHYIQMNDIDASDSFELQNGSGFQPIGTREQPFSGSFDGNGYIITALFVHNQRSSNNATGFFGYVKNGLIKNVTIDNETPGWNKHSEDSERFKSGQMPAQDQMSEVDLSNARGVGGMIGYNDGGTIRNSVYKGGVGGFIHQGVGGFAGVNTGLIENCHYTGDVSSGSTAGFVWTNTGQIRNSSAKGSASGMTSWGFVSTNYGEITNSYAEMEISG